MTVALRNLLMPLPNIEWGKRPRQRANFAIGHRPSVNKERGVSSIPACSLNAFIIDGRLEIATRRASNVGRFEKTARTRFPARCWRWEALTPSQVHSFRLRSPEARSGCGVDPQNPEGHALIGTNSERCRLHRAPFMPCILVLMCNGWCRFRALIAPSVKLGDVR